MSARRIVIGCSVVAVVVLAVLIVTGISAFRHYTAVVPIPPAARLADGACLGLAVLRLEADDPWIQGTFTEIAKYQTRESRPADLFPVEVVWAARRGDPSPEGHLLSASLSHSGRLLSLMGDFALWRASRSEGGKVSRVEHHGEAITSFPGTPIKGFVFLRGSSIVWSSDLDTARRAVDLSVAAEPDSPPSEPGPPSIASPVVSLIPANPPHALAGAILNENGSLARILELVPGDALDVPADRYAPVASLSITFDATSGSEGTGEVTLRLVPGTSPQDARLVADDIAARLPLLKLSKVTFEASPRVEADRVVVAVKLTGLDSLRAPLLEEMARSMKQIEKLQTEGKLEEEPDKDRKTPADPNQSSSTFQ